MKDQRVLRVSNDLRGMPVYGRGAGKRLGHVTDAIFHPIKGWLLGLIVQTVYSEAQEVSVANLAITRGAVLADEAPLCDVREIIGAWACKELIGSDVVTENGKLLGRIAEVYLPLDTHTAVYEVAGTGLRGILRRAYFIPGDVPSFYSRHGLRMIVPADTATNRSRSTIIEAM